MCMWSNMLGCSLASLVWSAFEYFLTSRRASAAGYSTDGLTWVIFNLTLKHGKKNRTWHTKKENNEDYYHGEKALVPELGKTVPDAPFENPLPSANVDISKSKWTTANIQLDTTVSLLWTCLDFTFAERRKVDRRWQEHQFPHTGRKQPQSTATSFCFSCMTKKVIKQF